MSEARLSILIFVLLAILVSQACIAQPEYYGFPQRLSNLTLLTPIEERKDLSSFEKTEILVVWLIRESRNPSPTTRGLGGDITSGYIQAQIITALFILGDPLTIAEIAVDRGAGPGIKDAMKIALGMKGDARQIPDLVRILQNSEEGYYRAKAAEALGLLGATEAIPALQEALNDEFSVYGSTSFIGECTYYPVRGAAEAALRKLGKPDRLSSARERNQLFAQEFNNLQQTLVPMRTYFTPRGWNITWDKDDRKAIAVNQQGNMRVEISDGCALVNDQGIFLSKPPVLKDGHMMIPRSLGVQMAYTASPLAQIARLPEPAQQ